MPGNDPSGVELQGLESFADDNEGLFNGDLDSIFGDDAPSSIDDDTILPSIAPGPPITRMVSTDSRRRSSASLQPDWHDHNRDLVHRRGVILQIAKLLRDRKQNPTSTWLKELPYKARKLEEQLYKAAPSLEAYLNEATLKDRLKKVARAITSQFRRARSTGIRTSAPARVSVTSTSSSLPDMTIGSMNPIHLNPAFPVGAEVQSLPPPNSPRNFNPMSHQQQAMLEQQILVNIRQQEEIMRSIMHTNHINGANPFMGNIHQGPPINPLAAGMGMPIHMVFQQQFPNINASMPPPINAPRTPQRVSFNNGQMPQGFTMQHEGPNEDSLELSPTSFTWL